MVRKLLIASKDVAVTRMLNLFAATGHINYTKSVRLYCWNCQKIFLVYMRCSLIKGFMQSIEAVDTAWDYGLIWLSSRL